MKEEHDILAEQQKELERIRQRRRQISDTDGVRQILNIAFLVLALLGLVLYFWSPDKHVVGLIVVGIGMIVKVAEFFIRFMC